MISIGKSIVTENGLVVASSRVGGSDIIIKGFKVSLWDNKNVLNSIVMINAQL